MSEEVLLVVYDDLMDPQARIKIPESFSYTENWYKPDEWEMKIEREKAGVDEIVSGGHIGWVDDAGTLHIGIIECIEQPRSGEGEQWTVSGRGTLAYFDRRKCMNMFSDATYSGYDLVTGVAYETAMRHYVDADVISATDTNRRMAGISLYATDYQRGGTCEKQARGESLLDILQDLMAASTLSCTLDWIGQDQTPTNRRLFEFRTRWGNCYQDTVKLSVDFGNVLSYKYLESILSKRNLIYVAGTGTGATRALRTVHGTTEPTGWDRFEDFIEATDCTTNDQLDQRGAEVLAEKGQTLSLEFEYNPASQSYTLGQDFGIGDIITVVDPDVATLEDRITSITTTYTGDAGKTVNIGLGTEPLDLISIARMQKKNVSGARS